MKTTTLLRRYIAGLGKHQLFTTRELLPFGSRGAIDSALMRWVRSGFLERLARGIFRMNRLHNRSVSACEVAAIKCRAYGKKMATIGYIGPQNSTLQDENEQYLFATDGSTSSFGFGTKRIVLKGIAPRKLGLGESAPGRALRELWSGSPLLLENLRKRNPRSLFGPQHQPKIAQLKRFAPEWLSSLFPKAIAKVPKPTKPIRALFSLWLKGLAPFSAGPFRQFSLQFGPFEAMQSVKTLSNARINNDKTPIMQNQILTFAPPDDTSGSMPISGTQNLIHGLFQPPLLKFQPPGPKPAPSKAESYLDWLSLQ